MGVEAAVWERQGPYLKRGPVGYCLEYFYKQQLTFSIKYSTSSHPYPLFQIFRKFSALYPPRQQYYLGEDKLASQS